jgi:hypothetical protein
MITSRPRDQIVVRNLFELRKRINTIDENFKSIYMFFLLSTWKVKLVFFLSFFKFAFERVIEKKKKHIFSIDRNWVCTFIRKKNQERTPCIFLVWRWVKHRVASRISFGTHDMPSFLFFFYHIERYKNKRKVRLR